MMKEKISRYIDGEGDKEEMEKLFKTNEEARKYFNELKEMKDVLSRMKVNAPPNIERDVLYRIRKKRRRLAYVVVSFAVVFLISVLFLKIEGLNIKNPGESTHIYRTAPEKHLMLPTTKGPSPQKGFDITVSKNKNDKIIEILKRYGTIKKQNENTFLYTLDSEKLPEVLDKLKEIAKVTNVNVKEEKGPITLIIKIHNNR